NKMEKNEVTHEDVQNFYSEAAKNPKADLCCPVSYPLEDTSHIPSEVIERFYGCGSPVSIAEIKSGETVVDLGSGAGIDCFIAARKTGPDGMVIGIDMTDNMLEVARKCSDVVSANLGYKNVEFRKGFLEEIPVESRTADLITSNCVINLSPNKVRVFQEMIRTLKDHGRILISDVISEVELPNEIKDDKQLWGECLGGCVTENQLISYLEQAGFYAVEILGKTFWKTVQNINFYSVSIRAYKHEKSSSCIFKGQKAVYNGPFKVIIDDEGHVFPRNQAVEICTDTAIKFSKPPYRQYFSVIESDSNEKAECCSPASSGRNGSTSCC
ncbi:MAG: methyltransferase domain-containing protein, partial [Thermodesulfobacteriota bacterium]